MLTPGTRTKNKEKRVQYKTINSIYLKKEIDRMYGRLEKVGQDTALVSSKLSDLKQRKRGNLNGLY